MQQPQPLTEITQVDVSDNQAQNTYKIKQSNNKIKAMRKRFLGIALLAALITAGLIWASGIINFPIKNDDQNQSDSFAVTPTPNFDIEMPPIASTTPVINDMQITEEYSPCLISLTYDPEIFKYEAGIEYRQYLGEETKEVRVFIPAENSEQLSRELLVNCLATEPLPGETLEGFVEALKERFRNNEIDHSFKILNSDFELNDEVGVKAKLKYQSAAGLEVTETIYIFSTKNRNLVIRSLMPKKPDTIFEQVVISFLE